MKARPRRPSLPVVRTLGEAWRVCPFRSIIADGNHNLAARIQAGFAAIGGEVDPIKPEMVAELAAVVRNGGAVVVAGSTKELRDHAKAEILLALTDPAGTA